MRKKRRCRRRSRALWSGRWDTNKLLTKNKYLSRKCRAFLGLNLKKGSYTSKRLPYPCSVPHNFISLTDSGFVVSLFCPFSRTPCFWFIWMVPAVMWIANWDIEQRIFRSMVYKLERLHFKEKLTEPVISLNSKFYIIQRFMTTFIWNIIVSFIYTQIHVNP